MNGSHLPPSTDLIRFEELGLNAWPAFSSVYADRWLLTFNGGFTYRANSVYVFGPVEYLGAALDERIATCEALYWARGLPCVFKAIMDYPGHAPLRSALEARGYTADDPAAIMTLHPLANLPALSEPSIPVTLARKLTRPWLAAYFAFSGRPPQHMRTMRRMMAQQIPPQRFASIRTEGAIIAVGRAVLDRGWVGLYNIATAPDERGQGFGRAIMGALLGWGARSGAKGAYLQVGLANVPALRLYTRLGFREAYSYQFMIRAPQARP